MPQVYTAFASEAKVNGRPSRASRRSSTASRRAAHDVGAIGTDERVAVYFGLRIVTGRLRVASANTTLDGLRRHGRRVLDHGDPAPRRHVAHGRLRRVRAWTRSRSPCRPSARRDDLRVQRDEDARGVRGPIQVEVAADGRGVLVAGDDRWTFDLDLDSGTAVLAAGGTVRRRCGCALLRWREKLALARFAGLGDPFLARAVAATCAPARPRVGRTMATVAALAVSARALAAGRSTTPNRGGWRR